MIVETTGGSMLVKALGEKKKNKKKKSVFDNPNPKPQREATKYKPAYGQVAASTRG